MIAVAYRARTRGCTARNEQQLKTRELAKQWPKGHRMGAAREVESLLSDADSNGGALAHCAEVPKASAPKPGSQAGFKAFEVAALCSVGLIQSRTRAEVRTPGCQAGALQGLLAVENTRLCYLSLVQRQQAAQSYENCTRRASGMSRPPAK